MSDVVYALWLVNRSIHYYLHTKSIPIYLFTTCITTLVKSLGTFGISSFNRNMLLSLL